MAERARPRLAAAMGTGRRQRAPTAGRRERGAGAGSGSGGPAARFPLMSWFDGCAISGIQRDAKPDRQIPGSCCAHYGLEPQATAWLYEARAPWPDDGAGNAEGARALIFRAMQCVSAHRLRRELRHRVQPSSVTWASGLTRRHGTRSVAGTPGPGQLAARAPRR